MFGYGILEIGSPFDNILLVAAVPFAGFLLLWASRAWEWLKWKRTMRITFEKFPHRKKHWFLGHLYDNPGVEGDVALHYMCDYVRQFPRIYHYALGPLRDTLVVSHPETVKALVKSSSAKPISNYGAYGFIKQWLGDGLLISDGNKWFRNRRLLTPAFHFDVLRPYIDIKNEAADKLILSNWMVVQAKFEKAYLVSPSVEVYNPISIATLESHPYVKAVLELAKISIHRILSPHLYPNWAFNASFSGRQFWRHVHYVHAICQNLINQRRRQLKYETGASQKRYKDFLDVLLLARDEEGIGLTDVEIRQEVDTFMFEGHDTTASGVSWALHTLAAHPEHQARAQREVDGLLRGRSPPHLTWEDMSALPYLTLCIKESLRLTPPVPVVGRELTAETSLEGRLLPAGAHVDITIYGVHHNPAVWGDDHMEYRPDRFLPDNINKMDSFAFIPFSAGARNCIGQNFAMNELKISLARIIHRFDLQLDPDHPSEHCPELITRAKDGIQLLLTPRNPDSEPPV